ALIFTERKVMKTLYFTAWRMDVDCGGRRHIHTSTETTELFDTALRKNPKFLDRYLESIKGNK
ncbi:11024_t:CDS:2, partial [Acaulospora morrowiae]